MKVFGFVGAGVASLMLSQGALSAPSPATTKACVDSFIEQTLETKSVKSVDVRLGSVYSMPMPLILRMEMPMQLTAVDKATGKTIATAQCDRKQGLVAVREHS